MTSDRLLGPLLSTGSLTSNLISSVLKYRDDRIIRMLQTPPEIAIAVREIHATIKRISKCEMNVLQSGEKKNLRRTAKRS
jgi:hypothetical protein